MELGSLDTVGPRPFKQTHCKSLVSPSNGWSPVLASGFHSLKIGMITSKHDLSFVIFFRVIMLLLYSF